MCNLIFEITDSFTHKSGRVFQLSATNSVTKTMS